MKALKSIFIVAIVMFAFLQVSCKEKASDSAENAGDGKVTIRGEVTNPQNPEVILEKIVDNQLIAVDTFMLGDDNKFSFDVEVSEPDYYRINIGGLQKRILILNTDDLTITAGGSGMNDEFKVEGSLEMGQIATIEHLMDSLSQDMTKLSAEYAQAQGAGDAEKVNALAQEYEVIRKNQESIVKEHINTMEPSLAVISALSFLSLDDNAAFVEATFDKVEAVYPESRHVTEFREQVDSSKKLSIGQAAPEIQLPNPQGDTVALSSLKGKVVLIDFWAAWCGPCRKENPNVVKMYQQYKGKGFEIYGVSLDRSRDAWLKAIKDDGLTWIHVSDLRYFDSVAAAIYNIQAIPFTVLIDAEGKIIAKNLRGKSLEDKLREILG